VTVTSCADCPLAPGCESAGPRGLLERIGYFAPAAPPESCPLRKGQVQAVGLDACVVLGTCTACETTIPCSALEENTP